VCEVVYLNLESKLAMQQQTVRRARPAAAYSAGHKRTSLQPWLLALQLAKAVCNIARAVITLQQHNGPSC